MRILVTNDDGYKAGGLKALCNVLRKFGELTVVAPKTAQSGMSMAVTMGYKPIAVKKLKEVEGERWWYLDGTPSSCVKYGIDNIFWPEKPDIVISGINHGSNAATAAIYSGTVGAAMEGAVNGIPSIAVSLDSFSVDADFSGAEAVLPGILEMLIPAVSRRFGEFYNINIPNLPAEKIKGTCIGNMGMGHWEKEYRPFFQHLESIGRKPTPADLEYVRNAEEGEEIFIMAGDFVSEGYNLPTADHLLLDKGWVTITPQNIDNTDYNEMKRLCDII